jgi:hypothetical protein
MNQRVPSWDLDDSAPFTASNGGLNNTVSAVVAGGSSFSPLVVPMVDQYYEVAELTWEKGNISSHGLLNRPRPNKYPPAAPSQLQAIGGGGGAAAGGDRETLEAVVGEAAARSHFPQPSSLPATPWLPADALVPCATRDEQQAAEEEARRKHAWVDGLVCASQGSAAPGHRGESATIPTCGTDVCGFTTTTTNNSTSLDPEDNKGSPDTENTSIGGGASGSRCFSRRSQANCLPIT